VRDGSKILCCPIKPPLDWDKLGDFHRFAVSRWRVQVRLQAVSRSIIPVYRGVQDGGVEVPVERKATSQGDEDNAYLSDSW
jgi:hypothetical protein